jgi:survival of motor neuron-related-splicing factor 30
LLTFCHQLDIVLSQLKDDPENAELLALQAELAEMIGLLAESLSELQPKQAPKKPSPPPPPVQEVPKREEKWSRDNHPAFKKAQQPAATTTTTATATGEDKEEAPIAYQVNDEVLAKWLSGDKKFWPARITSITGSSTAPIYTVKFKSYKGTETLRGKDIRPASNKRKAEGPPATTVVPTTPGPQSMASSSSSSIPKSAVAGAPSSAPPTGPARGVVMSAAASLYTEAGAETEKDGREAQGKPPRAKKIKAKKELEAGKNKWQEFNAKSKFGKSQKKDSMFRTPEGIHGRGQ